MFQKMEDLPFFMLANKKNQKKEKTKKGKDW